jgi:hypothetical protein
MVLLTTFFLLPIGHALGQVPQAERRAILDALRPVAEAELKGPVRFVVGSLQSREGWAFIQAEPQRPDGTPIDGPRIFAKDWENMDGLTTTAILKRAKRKWHVVEWRIGATDAWFCGPLPNIPFDPCRE